MPRKKDAEKLPLIELHPDGEASSYAAIKALVLPKKKLPKEHLHTTEENFFSVVCFKKQFKKDFPLKDMSSSFSCPTKIFKIFSLK